LFLVCGLWLGITGQQIDGPQIADSKQQTRHCRYCTFTTVYSCFIS